ncbi:unnamed protein product (macronuclear) [Paramecium tetraurelia]|uniref:ABC3 transporter permease C-terminal domain-containing protein n=1 Tax=Paramecium tetraurelia TaxID=5888 RepID=A0E0I3_PARTE|nr:uncharacterized protein GSPATT00021968001 [Paramecium tetraurelia]CAK88800.1 unnamed protein product [Paramecium tetraurelia]|eukprot:XP_001456197.1 hypothetical protein (macronuclear) [Paramecium tetraurelia strain d4-2]
MEQFHNQIDDTQSQQYFQEQTKSNVSLRLIINYIFADIAKRPRSFKIGLFTTYIVITFLGLLQCVVQLSPLIFLQLDESATGDTDLLYLPMAAENTSNYRLINMTDLHQHTSQVSEFLDVSPRWMFMCNLGKIGVEQQFRAYFLILDSQLEQSIGIGRRTDVDIINNNEVYVSETGLRGLNASKGDQIYLNFNIVQLLKNFGVESESNEVTQQLRQPFKNAVNKQLAMFIKEDNFQDKQYNIAELAKYSQSYLNYVKGIEATSLTKTLAKEYFRQNVRSSENYTDEQREFAYQVIDVMFERNMTRDAQAINNFVNRVSKFTTFITISQFEDGLFDLLIQINEFNINAQVHGGVESPKGKWTDALGMMVFMDYKNATEIFLESFFNKLDQVITDNKKNNQGMPGAISELIPVNDTQKWAKDATTDFKLQEYSLMANLLFKNRGEKYETPRIAKDIIIQTTNEFFTEAGYNYPVQITAPLGFTIGLYHLMKNFIENLLGVATMILLMLSVLLIYSLMIGDIEEKTYEFGMLRALGFKKSWLIVLLMLQALTFAIPGLFLGLVSCYLMNCLISMYVFDMSLLLTTYSIPSSALAFQISLGITMPIISNILPIKKALSKALRDSLDLFHRVVNDILVTVVKLEMMGISTNQTVCSIILIGMGFISYYVIPMNIIFQNIRGAIVVINVIFITMVIGVTVLMNLSEQWLERQVLKIILFIKQSDKNLQMIILNNLKGHGSRNFKTTLMYSLGLAFIIFTGAQFTLQAEFLDDFIKTSLTSDIIVFDASIQRLGLDEYKFRKHLEWEKTNDPTFIQDYTFSALPLNEIPGIPRFFQISPLAHFPRRRIRLLAIEENYLEVINYKYYYPTEYDSTQKSVQYLPNGVRDGVKDLYNDEGKLNIAKTSDVYGIATNNHAQSNYKAMLKKFNNVTKEEEEVDKEINVIIPEGYRYEDGVDVDTPALLRISFRDRGRAIERRLKIKHMAIKIPNNNFSGYRTVALFGEGLITMKDAQMLINEILNSRIEENKFNYQRAHQYFQKLPKNLTYGLPKDSLLIKFKRDTTKEERIDFSNRLRNYFTNDQIYLFDSITMTETSQDFFKYLELFNIVVAAIALILSFFLLLVSFIGNVRNTSWEIGILRAVGLNEVQISKVFVYESITLITASGLIGTIIGLVIATTFTLQIVAFSEFKFKFSFPILTFLTTFLGGIFISIYASYLAVRSFKFKSIASTLKGQS